jgi:hypothetical protein
MKELRVLFAVYILIILSIYACTKHLDVPAPTIDLGKQSAEVSFASLPTVENGKVIFSVQVTPGAKYSIQITDLAGDIKVKQGLLATDTIHKISLPLDKVVIGIYDVVVMDIKGNEIKQPIIKKF